MCVTFFREKRRNRLHAMKQMIFGCSSHLGGVPSSESAVSPWVPRIEMPAPGIEKFRVVTKKHQIPDFVHFKDTKNECAPLEPSNIH